MSKETPTYKWKWNFITITKGNLASNSLFHTRLGPMVTGFMVWYFGLYYWKWQWFDAQWARYIWDRYQCLWFIGNVLFSRFKDHDMHVDEFLQGENVPKTICLVRDFQLWISILKVVKKNLNLGGGGWPEQISSYFFTF